ncbi:hypothetical protein PLICRDRAFT_116720 [Plicaturopsis crispa FD-325 SS-3]|uniref:Cytochrome P450 n=1 Tax=Plicaturopsis crispa FD-325 SS-3 TaxID=944288 RepID=A0A0C9T7B9_PLICR|nr:hypothetical protein PLICRDRAFT_116720 [Plicaturopsis crispa FD-325 SS-3]
MSSLIAPTIILGAIVYLVTRLLRIGMREAGLPPGPPTLSLLGNLHVFPTEFTHLRLTEWAKQYGAIYSLKLGPSTAIVISSAAIVKSFMDKSASATTADRPANFLADRVAGGLNLVLSRYPEPWRTLRKTAHAVLTPQATARHLPIQKAEATQLMYDILKDPKARPPDFYKHARRYSMSVILSVLYGKRCPRYDTHEATAFFHSQGLWEHTLEFGVHPPLDLLPILQYVPERFAPWKTLTKEVRKLQRELHLGLLREVEENLTEGAESGCYMEEVMRRREEFRMTREMAAYFGAATIEGGADTTSYFLQTLILALTAFPEAQRKAHEEIDRVVTWEHLPTLEDFAQLPYIQAVVKEAHRWRPVAPLGVPHAATADEEFGGFLIPKGSTIFVNTWGIFHDSDMFDNPDIFEPDRFLRSEYGTKPGADDRDFRHTLAFGCGRRICPGIHLANNSLMLNAMNLIWAFNFDLAVDPQTRLPIPVDILNYHKARKGILTGPEPFECAITPRSAHHASLIEDAFGDAGHVLYSRHSKRD